MNHNYVTLKELSVIYKTVRKKDDGLLGRQIKSPENVYRLFSYLGNKAREHLVCIHLDSGNYILSYETVSIGNIDTTLVSVRSIFQGAIMANAKSIIIVHCHISLSKIKATPQDIDITKIIKNAGQLLDIQLLDHIIINHETFLSMQESGQF